MYTIDFDQLMENLKGKMGHQEIKDRIGVKKISLPEIKAGFTAAQALLDLHNEVCAEQHNSREIMMIK